MNTLIFVLQKLNWNEIAFSPRLLREIQQGISEVERSQFLAILKKKGSATDLRTVRQFQKQAAAIVSARQIADRKDLQKSIQEFRLLLEKTCGIQPAAASGISTNSEREASNNSSKTALFIEDYVLALSAFKQVSLVMVILTLLVGLVFSGHYLFTLIYGLVYNRKTCRVKAHMTFGQRAVYGYIVVLGRKGCRFEPEQALEPYQVKELLEAGPPTVNVLELEKPAVLNGVTHSYLSLYFDTPLGVTTLNQIFKASTCTPIYRRHDIMRPNLELLKDA